MYESRLCPLLSKIVEIISMFANGQEREKLKSEAISHINMLTGQKMSYFKFFVYENQTKQINYYMLMSLDNLLSITAVKGLQLR